jgi:uncharacterized damage-inducible protein DinB
MPHPLVTQLRFTRTEFKRAIYGVSNEDGERRFLPMNSLGWTVAHMAWHEQLCWLTRAQGQTLHPELNELAGYGKPASTPPLDAMWSLWEAVTAACDPYLDTLTSEVLLTHWEVNGKPHRENIGSTLRRITYHYWYHIGESQAVRQLLGHADVGNFVGALHAEAPYTRE